MKSKVFRFFIYVILSLSIIHTINIVKLNALEESSVDYLLEDKENAKQYINDWLKTNIDYSNYSLDNQVIIDKIISEYFTSIDEAKNKDKINWVVEKIQREIKQIKTITQEEAIANQTFYQKYIKNTLVGKIFTIIGRNYNSIFKGLLVTLELAFIAVFFGTILGTVLALMRLSKNKIIKLLSSTYVEIVRGIPLLLQLVTIYLLFSSVLGRFWAVALALLLNSGAYVAEIIRSGIQAVDKGQLEASRSLGIGYYNSMFKVILPQAIKKILPALGNEFVSVIKETSLAATFYIGDLMTVKNNITSVTYLALEPFIVVGAIYFILTFTLSKIVGKFERGLKKSD